MTQTKTALETLRIQMMALVLLAGSAIGFGLAHPGAARADAETVVAPVATVATLGSSYCRLDGASRCNASATR